MVNYNGRKIIYTFKYGAYITLTDKLLYVLATVLFFLFFGISLFMVCHYVDNDSVTYKGLIVSCVAGLIYLATTVYCICKAKRVDKDISKWLKDESLFESCAEVYEFEEWYERGSVSYKLGISFKNNGEQYRQYTSRSESIWRFKKICNLVKSNKLEILYSPKYGEVMVLAEQVK